MHFLTKLFSVSVATIIFILITTGSISAQSLITLRGKIIESETSKPVPFASLQIRSQGIGTSANELGEFILKVDQRFERDTLMITSVGYKSLMKPVGGVSNYQIITLQPVVTQLKEVTVT